VTELTRFLIFSVLAAVRTLLELVLWRWLVKVFEQSPAALSKIKRIKLNQYSFAHAMSFIASVVASYFLNYYITFGDTDETSNPLLLAKFVLISLLTLGISVLVINVLTTNRWILAQSKKIGVINQHWPLLAKLITILVTMVINYLGYKLWVFEV
jgi:putative flippase GtrA